jgi:hypothetical protein
MASPDGACCFSCHYYDPAASPEHQHVGVCRRNPPLAGSQSWWPVVADADWCGEWAEVRT